MASVGHSPTLPLVRARDRARRRRARRRTAIRALTLRQTVGVLSLAGLLGTTATVVASAASRPSHLVPARFGGFPDWLRGPLSTAEYVLFPSDFAWVMVAMLGCYLLALLCAEAIGVRWLMITTGLLHLMLFLGPPMLSADAFGYLDWARMGVLHDLNPYATDSGEVVSDPINGFVRWGTLTSPYGPFFTLGSYTLVPLGLPGSLWALKAAVVLASLGCVVLLWRCARALGRSPVTAVALYGLNPAVLVYTVGGFHNDTIMMVALMGAVYLAITGRETAGAAMGAVAVAVKSSAGLVMPFLILGARDRVRTLRAGVIAGVGVLVIGLAAFGGEAFDFIRVLGAQQRIDSPTSVPAQLGAVFGWVYSPPPVRIVASVLGIAALIFCLVRTARGGDWIEWAGWATVALMVTTSWLLAWYIVWLVPLAALARRGALHVAAVGATLFVVGVRIAPGLGL